MFRPNNRGSIRSIHGRDIHGRHKLGVEKPCMFSIVSLVSSDEKTSVRSDSSGSRGSASETVAHKSKILVLPKVKPSLNDIFGFNGISYEITGLNPRYSVCGALDHIECDMEIYIQ